MHERFWGTLPILDIGHKRWYDAPGCPEAKQVLPEPANVHLIFADPWPKELGQPQ